MMRCRLIETTGNSDYAHIIFPYVTPKDYYIHKVQKSPKGRVINQARLGRWIYSYQDIISQIVDGIAYRSYFSHRAFG